MQMSQSARKFNLSWVHGARGFSLQLVPRSQGFHSVTDFTKPGVSVCHWLHGVNVNLSLVAWSHNINLSLVAWSHNVNLSWFHGARGFTLSLISHSQGFQSVIGCTES